jgi:hypothetical protein
MVRERKKQRTVEEHIDQMTADLTNLATKLNEIRNFDDALKVQHAIITVNKLAETSEFSDFAWPPVVDREDDGYVYIRHAQEIEDDPQATPPAVT